MVVCDKYILYVSVGLKVHFQLLGWRKENVLMNLAIVFTDEKVRSIPFGLTVTLNPVTPQIMHLPLVLVSVSLT